MKRTYQVIQIMFICITIIVALTTYHLLPQEIATHWNIHGQVDGWGNKALLYRLMPALSIAILLLMKGLPYIDPKKEKYALFANTYEGMQTIFTVFFTYMFCVFIYCNIYGAPSITFFMLIGIGLLFVLLGNVMGKLRQNYFVGIKTPWTISNELVRNKTHRLGGLLRVLGGVTLIIEAFVMKYLNIVCIIVIATIIIVPIAYSYRLFKNVSHKNNI